MQFWTSFVLKWPFKGINLFTPVLHLKKIESHRAQHWSIRFPTCFQNWIMVKSWYVYWWASNVLQLHYNAILGKVCWVLDFSSDPWRNSIHLLQSCIKERLRFIGHNIRAYNFHLVLKIEFTPNLAFKKERQEENKHRAQH